MREILFRAKTEPNSKDVITGEIIKNPKWVYGYVDLGYDDVAIISSISGNRAYRCDPATVGQYTGLNDKNGKKIFEGDVFRVTRPCVLAYGKITFENGCFWFVDDGPGGMLRLCDAKMNGFQIEIIGNIYDNPELLEEVQ